MTYTVSIKAPDGRIVHTSHNVSEAELDHYRETYRGAEYTLEVIPDESTDPQG